MPTWAFLGSWLRQVHGPVPELQPWWSCDCIRPAPAGSNSSLGLSGSRLCCWLTQPRSHALCPGSVGSEGAGAQETLTCSGEAGLRAASAAGLATPVMTQHRLGNRRVALAFAVFWGSLQVGGWGGLSPSSGCRSRGDCVWPPGGLNAHSPPQCRTVSLALPLSWVLESRTFINDVNSCHLGDGEMVTTRQYTRKPIVTRSGLQGQPYHPCLLEGRVIYQGAVLD